MAVEDIRLQSPDQAHEMQPRQEIRWTWLAVNGKTVNAELEPRCDLLERSLGAFAAGQAIGDQAHMVPAIGLAINEIQDVAEDSADRRPHGMQDTQRLICIGGHFRTSARRRGWC